MIKKYLKKSYLFSSMVRILLLAFRELPPLFKLSFLLPQKVNNNKTKFVILAQTRSGTHLLQDLLNRHPDIYCEKELFDHDLPRLFSPQQFLEGKRNCFRDQSFGFILHLRHILMMKSLEQDEFLSELHKNGWSIIYIDRENVLRQQVSLEIGKQRRLWHTKSKKNLLPEKYKINPVTLLSRMRLREIKRRLVEELLVNTPYLNLVYENDLLDGNKHQSTLDRVFDFLQLSPVSVTTSLTRTSDDSLRKMIENYEEVEEVMIDSGFGKLLASKEHVEK